jgi:dephospho-CoA kinase
MKIIGLAGNIGSGKSTTAAYLRSLGFTVFDSENAAKSAALEKGSPCLQKAAELFGPGSILPDGRLNRPWVAEKIFHDAKLMQQFEAIMQEQVWNDLQHFLEIQKDCGTAAVFLDLPLMIELGWHTICNSIWLIATPDDIRIRRAIARDRDMGKEAVMKRNNTQLPVTELRKYADAVIDNSGSFEQTIAQINELLRRLGLQM